MAMDIYLLWHAHNLDDTLDVELLGVYSSEQNAESARQRAKSRPGFQNYPEQFDVIDRYQVDKDLWDEGVITV